MSRMAFAKARERLSTAKASSAESTVSLTKPAMPARRHLHSARDESRVSRVRHSRPAVATGRKLLQHIRNRKTTPDSSLRTEPENARRSPRVRESRYAACTQSSAFTPRPGALVPGLSRLRSSRMLTPRLEIHSNGRSKTIHITMPRSPHFQFWAACKCGFQRGSKHWGLIRD